MISLSMRGLAEVMHASPNRKAKVLRKYKFKKSGESKGRANYYVKAITIIRRHHHGDVEGRDELMSELAETVKSGNTPRAKTQALNNLRVASSYLSSFGTRAFTIKKGVRLYYIFKDIEVSTQPDLVVEENGKTRLIKLNCCKESHPSLVVMTMLHAMYLAGKQKQMISTPDQVECLQVASESTVLGSHAHFQSAKSLENGCNEVIALWPTVS